jgi:hypothetical protein
MLNNNETHAHSRRHTSQHEILIATPKHKEPTPTRLRVQFAFVMSYNITSIIFFHNSKHSVSDSVWSYNSRSSYGYSGYSR